MRLLAQSSTVSRAGRGAQPRTRRAFSLVCRLRRPSAGVISRSDRSRNRAAKHDHIRHLPGATLVPHATNVAGRAGIGIMWTSKTARQVYKNEWIFDKTTLRFIGEKTYDPGTGRLTGESAIIQQAFTAQAGQVP